MFQSLFYWITYSYEDGFRIETFYPWPGFNPYFIGLPILISLIVEIFNFVNGIVSILILLDYLFLSIALEKQ